MVYSPTNTDTNLSNAARPLSTSPCSKEKTCNLKPLRVAVYSSLLGFHTGEGLASASTTVWGAGLRIRLITTCPSRGTSG